MFIQPPLPYALDALEPHMSRDTLSTHYGKHHAAYVEKTNKLVKEAGITASALEDVIAKAKRDGLTGLYQNAAQAWNHAFFWECMSPERTPAPGEALSRAIAESFGSLEAFREKAISQGEKHFASGWLWLTTTKNGALSLIDLHDADTPIAAGGGAPILVCDLWEHAYYLDHKNARRAFLEVFFDKLCDWRFVDAQFEAALSGGTGWRYPAAHRKAA